MKQAAAADVLVLTKPDLSDETSLDSLERELLSLNPTAPVLRVAYGDVDPELLLRAGGRPLREVAVHTDTAHDHAGEVRAVVLELDWVVDWTAFGIWLTMLLHARGSDIYRVKGLLDVGGEGPLLVNGVQHAVHPPVHLDSWPDDERRSRLVLIGRGVDAGQLTASLRAFDQVARL